MRVRELETRLAEATQSATVEWGRIRYAAGQAFVDFHDDRRERVQIEQMEQVLSDAPWDSEVRFLAENARFEVPPDELQDLANTLRRLLSDYIDPESDRIGHGFPAAGARNGHIRALRSGLRVSAYVTPVSAFAKALVRASLALGAARVAAMAEGWLEDRPLYVRTSAILSGIRTTQDLILPEGVEVNTLPVDSDALPLSVPRARQLPVLDALGATLLTVDSSISPPLFRPLGEYVPGSVVQLQADDCFRSVWALCDALALATGQFVRPRLFWTDYGEVSALGSAGDGPVWRAGDPFSERWKRVSVRTDTASGTVTLRNRQPEPPSMSECDLRAAWEIHAGLWERKSNDLRFRTALERWLRSRRPDLSVEDHFIDLRVALEALYLDGDSGELAHRLATRLAWHLGTSPDERKRLFNETRRFYRRASGIVHGGGVRETEIDERLLDQASSMCRRALLEHLKSGMPDWGTLVFGS